MKEFFKQCLDDLEAKTGIRQLYYLQLKEDGAKQTLITIEGMVQASKKFPYISEEDQRLIILRMIEEDQEYDALNSRTVWKWLNLYAGHFHNVNNATEESPRIVHTPEQEENIKKISSEWLAQLAGNFKPEYKGLGDEIKRIQKEDEEREKGKKGSGYVSPSKEEVVMHDLHLAWIRFCFDPISGKPSQAWMSEEEFIKLQFPS